MTVSLQGLKSVKDLMLPSLYMAMGKHPDVELKAEIDEKTHNIIVSGLRKSKGWELGFAVTSEAIKDGTYIKQFANNLKDLLEALSEETTPAEVL